MRPSGGNPTSRHGQGHVGLDSFDSQLVEELREQGVVAEVEDLAAQRGVRSALLMDLVVFVS